MKNKLLIFWWQLTSAKRFRVEHYDIPGSYTPLMNYYDAFSYVNLVGGQIVVQFK